MTTIYEKYCLPLVINYACSLKPIMRQRQKIVPLAAGRVLEVGLGAGLNLPYYDTKKVEMIWGLEPSKEMRETAREATRKSPIRVEWLPVPAEQVPLDTESVDTVLLTFTLCTIPDWQAALREMHRVLKPEGILLFCEHGAAPDESTRKWQTRLTPFWKGLAGGCHLDRPIPRFLEIAGFRIVRMESEYIPGVPRIAGFNYWGVARKA